ncbi:hypothetical protein BC567DRAFT_228050 [Phyllosticta citribraziliensis]
MYYWGRCMVHGLFVLHLSVSIHTLPTGTKTSASPPSTHIRSHIPRLSHLHTVSSLPVPTHYSQTPHTARQTAKKNGAKCRLQGTLLKKSGR